MNIRNAIPEIAEEVTAYRRAMHEHPQTAYEETFASDLVAEQLSAWDIPHERGIAVTGIVATIEGTTNTSGKAIALRADMDALDILEAENKPHVSKIPGKMHGCGHDGHTAILLGAAKYLSENNNFDGKVHLIFQPAEEGHGGAFKMIEEGLFERFPCDEAYALHNWPALPKGTFATRPGPIMAAADRFSISIKGKGGHAASPHKCIDPIIIGTEIVSKLQNLISRELGATEMAVISITNFHGGTGAYNVISETAKLSGTLRSFDPVVRKELQNRIKEVCIQTAESLRGGAVVKFDDGAYDPTINTPEATEFCLDIARKIFGDENVTGDTDPCMGAEDFGAILQQRPGCYVMIGQAEEDKTSNHNHGLHTPQYDFNDDIIAPAIEYWVSLVEAALPLGR